MPELYWGHVRVFDPSDGHNKRMLMPFLLPHELIAAYIKKANRGKVKDLSVLRLGKSDRRDLQWTA